MHITWNVLKYFVKLTDLLTATAFAEHGEHETARKMIWGSHPLEEHGGEWERDQTAIVFAESNEFDTARDILRVQRWEPAYPDDCQYGDNDLCYSNA